MSDALVDVAKTDIALAVSTRLEKLKTDLKALQPVEPAPIPPTGGIYDDFKYICNLTPGQKTPNNKWICSYLGSKGYAKTDGNGMIISPEAIRLDMYGGSALVLSTMTFANHAFDLDITNQRRTVTEGPEQWMCPWVLYWHVNSKQHYYFYIGTQHMEWGKKDAPATATTQAQIEQYQYTLWTGGPPAPFGQKMHIGVEVIGERHKVYCNGVLVMDKTDNGILKDSKGRTVPKSLFKSGQMGLYPEGAQALYQIVRVTPK